MPFQRPTPQQIRDRMAAEIEAALPGADARTRRSIEGVLARMMAIASHELHGHQDWIARQILVDTADAEALERHASIWGIARRPAMAASGTITLTGQVGAIVPAGAELRRSDDVRYRTEADATIGAGGTAAASVVAVATAALGNAPIGAKLTLIAPVAGVQSQATVADDGSGGGLSGGADLEPDTSLRARILARIQTPPHGGAAHDYVAWVKEITGETLVWVYPTHIGLGTVGISFVMPDGTVPTATVVDQVQAHIDAVRPVTADVTVFAPVIDLIAFDIRLAPDTVAVRAAVEAELADLFLREAQPGGTLKLSRLGAAISAAAGEDSHELLAPAADVVSPAGHLARLGAITWTA